MNKIKRVSAFILVLSLVLSAFSVSFADEQPATLTDVYGNANEQAITVCNYLGIVNGNPDGKYLPDQSVKRAEFAAMITRALAVPESALQGYNFSKFKDTDGYGWAVPYLAFCESKGIMLGDGQGNVMPGKTISLNEAITMALRAAGYTAGSSLLTGSWPANYISIAQNNDLYEDVAGDAIVNRANAAQIIYNALFIQKVSVSTTGETTFLDTSSKDAATMLNTGLKCTMEKGFVDLTAYPDSLINLVPYMGAYGEIYLNKDEEVVAVNPTVTCLYGYFNKGGKRFDLLDGTYLTYSNTEYTTPASLEVVNSAEKMTFTSVAAFGGRYATLFADVSGDKITKIYSTIFWDCDDFFEVDDGILTEISEDKTVNGWKLPLNDDGEIDYTQLCVYGAATLADIKEGDNLYLYQDYNTDDVVNYIEVGTAKISGEVTEFDNGGDYYDVYYINDKPIKSYKGVMDLDVGSTYDIDLDAWGYIYDAEKTSGKTDTYGVVIATASETKFDNFKVKLYNSDDSTKTFNLSEANPAKIDWATSGGLTIGAVAAGGLIGYSLDSNGDIDAIDNTFITSSGIEFKSAKVLGKYSIDPDAVVFTYNGTMSNTSSYNVVKLSDIDAGTTVATTASPAAFILKDGDVVALFIEDDFANAADDAVYGVIDSRKTTSNSDGEKVYKFTGYIDGAAFTNKTDDDGTDFDDLTSKFGVYAITLDSSGQITKIAPLDLDGKDDDNGNTCSYLLNESDKAEVITGLASSNTVISVGSAKYTVAENAIVYKYDTADKEYTVSKLSSLKKGCTVSLYDTKGEDSDGIASVVIYIAN